MDLGKNTGQILHMVTHFVRYHVGIGEVATGSQLLLHGGEEREVDVELLVAWAIERTHSCRTLSTGGSCSVGIEHHLRHYILSPVLAENLSPYVFCTSQYLGRELSHCLFFLGKLGLTFRHLRIAAKVILLNLLHHSCYRVAT